MEEFGGNWEGGGCVLVLMVLAPSVCVCGVEVFRTDWWSKRSGGKVSRLAGFIKINK